MGMRSFMKLGGTVTECRLSESQLRRDMAKFRPFRIAATVGNVVGLIFNLISLCSPTWMIGEAFSIGIWDSCYHRYSADLSISIKCSDQNPYWQNGVIGLLIFSLAFGTLATVLSVCGICALTLARKMYYYHSAGEIYFVCALSCTAAMIVYPVALIKEKSLVEFSYGIGYGLGWGASIFFSVAAMCMCLDDIVRAFTEGPFACFKRSSPSNKNNIITQQTTSGV